MNSNWLRLFLLEWKRLLHSRPAQLAILVSAASPLAGLFLWRSTSADTMLSRYLADPAIAAGTAGGIAFGLLTILELDRPSSSRAGLLTDSVVPPHTMALVRLPALLLAAALITGLTMLLWFPILRSLIGPVFPCTDYILAFLIFMGLALPLGILAAASAYQAAARTDLALAAFLAFAFLSLTVWADSWQLCWLNPCVWALSDDFTNFRIFRSVAYMRLTWLGALAGAWTLSCCCIRRYQKGCFASFALNVRRIRRPALALLLLLGAGAAYRLQPMVDHGNPDQTVMSFFELPFLDGIVCTGRTAKVVPDTSAGTVTGTAAYQFRRSAAAEPQELAGPDPQTGQQLPAAQHTQTPQPQTAAFGINPGYTVFSVQANGKDVPFSVSSYQEFNEAMLTAELPADPEIELTIEYGGFPQENRNLSTMQGNMEISAEYLCLEHGAMAPRLMNVLPDEGNYPADIQITLPSSMTLIPFGPETPERIARHDDGTSTWEYQYHGTGGICYAGDYIRQDIQAGGISIEFYYGRRHQAVMEAAGAPQAVKAAVDYCTSHYGSLSFGSGKALKLIQSRVLGGGYAADGASLLDEADFTAANLSDAGKGTVPGEVMIHELVHQWWGLANMFAPSDGTDPWSAEGLTVYTTYRIVQEQYGSAYAQEHYVRRWQQAVDDYYQDFYVRFPEYLEMLPPEKQTEITNRSSYVRQYCEMPLKIWKAEKLVGGEAAMDQILKQLFQRELDPAYPYLTYEDFLDACGLREEDLDLDSIISL
ncbi:MAG TPA: hypothetical protein IAC37_08560 [Candidatus Ventrimonas merdavium]|nr:hypothetical protein [Candidatus Ventrimonas merdavium]